MKILFAMSSPEYLRFYDATIAELAARGHHVVVAASHVKEGKPVRFERYAAERVTQGGVIPSRDDRWTELARAVRGTMDFVRYLHPRLADAAALRARMKRQALPLALQWLDGIHSLRTRTVERVMRALSAAERAIPIAPAVGRLLDAHDPDVVLVSPLVEAASSQVDLVRAAMARGIRVGTCIASWDNLTNKGDLRVASDAVFVWNEAQAREAVELHRIPADRVVVTGSQVFDRWFDRTPSLSREAFCREAGLAGTGPFVLFVGSSIFIARAEVEVPFIRRWIQALRSSALPALRGIGVLVRPHPYNGQAWDPDALADLPGVAVWPRGGYDPVDERNRDGFFDSMYHSEAVVGINTSAMIESAIVGRPVLTILAPEFAGSQAGTLHFHHLLPEQGGFLRVATGLDEHVEQLGGVLSEPDAAREELSRFVASFVRPHGLGRPATPILAGAIEALGQKPAADPERAAGSLVLRWLLYPLAILMTLFPDEALRKRRKKKARERERRASPPVPAPAGAPAAARPNALLALVVALPLVAATGIVLAFAVAESMGRTPLSYPRPRNIAEAAGMGLAPEVLRFMREGEDAGRVMPVDPDIISSVITQVNAYEAAIWSRRVELVQLLDRERPIADPAERQRLACLAADLEAQDILTYLSGGESAPCEPKATARAIEARTRD